MAAQAPAMEKLDAQLTCSVCLDRYVDPRVLTCHHSFCKNCIIPMEQGRLVVKCPICREPTQLREGTSSLPVAFHVNQLLEINDELNKEPAIACVSHSNGCENCTEHERPLDFYCETCDEFICLNCSKESHQQHQYDSASKGFEKNKQEIKSCLEPVKDQIREISDKAMPLYDVVGKMIQDQSENLKEDIVLAVQKIANELERRKENLLEQVDRATLQKTRLNLLKRDEVNKVLAELNSCNEFVEEELNSQSPYQLHAVKKSLVQKIADTRSKVIVSELQPDQEPDTRFVLDQMACSVGKIVSSLNFQPLCNAVSVSIPAQIFTKPGQETCIPVVMPMSISSEQVTTTFFSLDNPIQEEVLHPPVVQEDDRHFKVCLQPRVTGLHEFSMDIGGIPVKGSPFTTLILPSVEMREQGLNVVARGLKCPYNSVVTEDGQHIVVVEQEGNRVTILTTAGKVVRQFGRHGQGPGKFNNPHSVAVSSSNHIFVADLCSIQKFKFSGSHVRTVSQSVRGLVFHPKSGKLLTISKNHCIEVFNLNLSYSHSYGDLEQLVDACDLAVDTKGMVYVLTIKHGIHKFSSDLKSHVSNIKIDDDFSSCLVGICVDSFDNIYVTDGGNNGSEKPILMLSAEGKLLARFGNRRHRLHGIAINKTGDLFVCHFAAGEVLVYKA